LFVTPALHQIQGDVQRQRQEQQYEAQGDALGWVEEGRWPSE